MQCFGGFGHGYLEQMVKCDVLLLVGFGFFVLGRTGQSIPQVPGVCRIARRQFRRQAGRNINLLRLKDFSLVHRVENLTKGLFDLCTSFLYTWKRCCSAMISLAKEVVDYLTELALFQKRCFISFEEGISMTCAYKGQVE